MKETHNMHTNNPQIAYTHTHTFTRKKKIAEVTNVTNFAFEKDDEIS